MSVSSSVETAKDNSAHSTMSLWENSRGIKTISEMMTLIWLLVLFELCQATAHSWLSYHFFPSKYELVCVCRAGGSMSEEVSQSVQMIEQTAHGYFLFLLLVDSVMFCLQKTCMFNNIWMKDICIVEYCTENCCVRRLYLFLKFWTHFEFWFVLNTVFLALLSDHVNIKTSK